MIGKQRMHNHVAPPAGVPRAASAHVLDLTSLCVKSGSVQLPPALVSRFQPGRLTARSDGGELTLEFHAPRTLAGLGPFFAAHGLRANDGIEFSFEGGAVGITARRRDRQREARQRADSRSGVGPAARESAEGPSTNTAPRPSARSENWAEAVDRQMAASVERQESPRQVSGKGIVVDRFKGATEELVSDAAASAQRDAVAPEDVPPAARVDPKVRSVTKVRIEGGVPAGPALAPVRPKDRSSAHRVWARRENAQWHPLDALQEADPADRERDPEFPGGVVRAYRRGANGSLRHEPFYLTNDEKGARPDAPPVAPRNEREATPRSAPLKATLPASPEAGLPPRWPRSQATGAVETPGEASRPGEGRSHRTARPVGPETPPARTGGAERAPHDGRDGRRLDADPETAIVLDDPAFEPADPAGWTAGTESGEAAGAPLQARSQRRGVFDRLGLRLRMGRERPRVDAGPLGPSAGVHPVGDGLRGLRPPTPSLSTRVAPPASPHGLNAQAEALSRPVANLNGGWGEDRRPHHDGVDHGAARGSAPRPAPAPRLDAAAPRPTRPAANAVQEALLDAETLPPRRRQEPAGLIQGEGGSWPPAPAPTASVEEDIAFLEGYLLRPGTPAIVRSIDLAEKLGMSPERTARAMDRLSEHRERFSKIKDGAYMVRQLRKPQG